MYSFGGNMTDSKGIALPVNVRFKGTLVHYAKTAMSKSISLPFSATDFIIWSPPALYSARNTPGECKLYDRWAFSGANSHMEPEGLLLL